MDKTKNRGHNKEHKCDIQLNKSTTAIVRLNIKSPITIDFKNIEKLAGYDNSNYALRETRNCHS